jgi:hypothetical protein
MPIKVKKSNRRWCLKGFWLSLRDEHSVDTQKIVSL